MTDQTIPAVTDDDRKLARNWAESIASDMDTWGDGIRTVARVVLDAVPTPPTTTTTTATTSPAPPAPTRASPAAPNAAAPAHPYATNPKENPRMTDQIPADKVREILDEWERIKEYADWEAMDNLVQDVRDLLPPPTLADMTEDDLAECQWMQADTEARGRAIIIVAEWVDGHAELLDRWGNSFYAAHDTITPRPDLPRMTWPGDTPAPAAPALPEGWRLADHQEYGRVVVTNPTPDADGYVYFVLPARDVLGYDWFFCTPDELTYIDQKADQ